MSNEKGSIYILTNPSFPQWVKIGYADDVKKRLDELNRSECIPFAFRLYGYYEVNKRLTDKKLHEMIDKLNPTLRSTEEINGKMRKREFYNMSAADAFSILETIAQLNGLEEKLHLVPQTEDEKNEEELAEKARTRHILPKLDWLVEQGVVNIGDKICMVGHEDKTAILIDDKHLEFEGESLSLNAFAKKITGWNTIGSYSYAKLVRTNKTLAELREEKMQELGMIDEE